MRRVGAVVLVFATGVAGACGFAEKKELADRIRTAPARMDAAETARVGFTLSPKILKPKLTAAGFERAFAGAEESFDIDFARRTAVGRAQMTSGPILYQRRLGAAAKSDGRPWVKLDLRDLYDDRENLQSSAYGINALGPLVLIDLLRGALTGSVRRVGSADLDGVETTHYRANFAFDKAFDDAPDDLREGVEAALAVMGSAYDGIAKGEVWLDADGLPRRVLANVRASRGRQQEIELQFTLELSDFGAATTVHLPLNKDIERVNSVSELTSAAGVELPNR